MPQLFLVLPGYWQGVISTPIKRNLTNAEDRFKPNPKSGLRTKCYEGWAYRKSDATHPRPGSYLGNSLTPWAISTSTICSQPLLRWVSRLNSTRKAHSNKFIKNSVKLTRVMGRVKAGLWCGKTNPKNIWDIICFLFPYQLQDKPLSHIRWMQKLTLEQLVVERSWCFCICDVWCQNYHHIPEWVFIVLDHPWWGPPKMSHMGRLDYPRQRFLGLPLSLKLIDHKHHVKVFLTN